MVYKCLGVKKFSYKDKKTGVQKNALIFFGVRQFTNNETNNSLTEGFACEEKFISETNFGAIPDGSFKVGNFYSFKTISDGFSLQQLIETCKDFE